MKTINDYEIVNHGVENEQYFQGCGVCFTSFEDVATGIGDSASDALEDALECLALNGWDTSSVINDLSTVITVPKNSDGCWHYVSIRVR